MLQSDFPISVTEHLFILDCRLGEKGIEGGNAEAIKEFYRVSGNNAGTYRCYEQ